VIVVDASALVEQLLATPKGLKLHQRCLIAGESLHAPHLLDLEVVNVLRRYWQRDILSISRADQALEDLLVFPLTVPTHQRRLPLSLSTIIRSLSRGHRNRQPRQGLTPRCQPVR